MRDYKFGNFLHELRTRRGLSQFQLGMLVGVSDKAVSKWENGLARPQSRILYQLCEILGVSVDELLSCRYRPVENRDKKGVFAMKKALWKKAEEKLKDLYGEVPPMEVANRFFSERAELEHTEQIVYFDFLGRMAELAGRGGGHVHVSGGIGASFVAFVLGASGVNPLRPHYYCPACRKVRFAEGASCGWDLPAGTCSCGKELVRDGHDLPFETLRPLLSRAARYDVTVSRNLYQEARETIAAFFRENRVVTLTREEPEIRTYVILDAESPDPAKGQELPFEENYDRFRQYPAITLIRSEELDAWRRLEEETGIPFGKVPFADKEVLEAFLSGSTEGIPEFQADYVRKVLAESAPASACDLIQVPGLCHGVGVWEGNGRELVRTGMPLNRLMAYRDDVFRYVQERMKAGSGWGTGYACRVMEDVGRGRYAQNGIPAEVKRQLQELGAEEWFLGSVAKIGYLFPKAHGIPYVKRAMVLMWYKVHYPACGHVHKKS